MRRHYSLVIAFLAALVFILLTHFGLGPSQTLADDPSPTPPPPKTPVLPTVFAPGKGPWVVKAWYANQAMLNHLAAQQEPWEVNKKEGYAIIEVYTFFDYLRLENEGYRLEVDKKLTAELNRPRTRVPGQMSGIPGYPCYRTVEETFTSAQIITTSYPNLAEWIDAGDSWEKTESGGNAGYDMMVLKLTNTNISGPKPKVFIMSSVHAREYTPAELNTRLAEYLVANYGVDPDVTWLLDYNEFHLLLQANPDGRKHAESGFYWRKNTNQNYCSPTSNNRGADLNRNFEFQWACCGGSSANSCAQTYHGSNPASEPETQAVQNYLRSIFPDLRPANLTAAAPVTTTGIFIDVHSYGQLTLWPWGFTGTVAPNGVQMQTLGRKFAYFNGYWPVQAIGLYATDGTTDDFGYGDLGLPAYTFELGTNFFQDCATFENTILPNNLPALIYAAKAAHRPYLAPAGPDALDLSLSAVTVSSGEVVTLTAVINDARYNNSNGTEPAQNISVAAYVIDTPHWISSTPATTYTMSPLDGSFDEPVEDVVAAIDTSGLSIGRHTVFVRGQDTDGNWGVYSAIFLDVVEPGPVLDFAPLSFTVALTSGHTTSRTLTISNAGASVLTWSLEISPPVGWLGASALSGTIWLPPGSSMGTVFLSGTMMMQDSQAIGLYFDAAGLMPDTYTTTLRIPSNHITGTAPVTLAVVAPRERYQVYLPLVLKP